MVWDVLLADLVPVEGRDDVARLEFGYRFAIGKGKQTPYREKQSVGDFAAQFNGGYVPLIGIHVAADVLTGFVLFAEQVIGFREFFGELTVRREVHAEFVVRVVQRDDDGVSEALADL